MATNYHHSGDADDRQVDYELRETPQMERDSLRSFVNRDRASSTTSTDQEWRKNSCSLPPKSLPIHPRGRITPRIAIVSSITMIIIIGLIILLSLIKFFEPSVNQSGLDNSVSCDLWAQNASSVQNAFTINLRGASELTFTQAKVIDVIWQLVVGAGGRICLAWISYVVFMDGLTRLIEHSPVSYLLYASMTFQTTSIYTTWYAMTAVVASKGWRSKLFLAWFSFATIYVLGFPTLMSATAGYLTPSTAGFNMPDHSFIGPNSDDLTNCLNVTAGSLIGIPNGTIINGPPLHMLDQGADAYSTVVISDYNLKFSSSNVTYADFFALTSDNVTEPLFDVRYSEKGPNSMWSSQDGTGSPQHGVIDYNYTTNITFRGVSHVFHNYKFRSLGYFCYKNKTLPYQSLKEIAGCLPESYFVWGLSSLLVKIMLAVWLDANIYSALCRSGRKIRGPFRAADDLSEAMREVLGNEYCAYSDSQLARELKYQHGVHYYSDDVNSNGTSHIGLSSVKLRKVALDNSKLYGTRKRKHR